MSHKMVIINEKPSQARNFAKALSGMSGTYKGEVYEIVALRGHVLEFVNPSDMVPVSMQEQVKSWDVANLPWDSSVFSWKYRMRGDVAAVVSNLKNSLSDADMWVIATDDDPSGEGQLLAWEALSWCGLATPARGIWRMYFEDESEKSIKKAFDAMKRLPDMVDDPEYKKSFFRARLDFLSMQWTRIATSLSPRREITRLGRLKAPMCLYVGDAIKAHDEYVKHVTYQNRFRDENGVVYKSDEEPVFESAEEVPKSYHVSEVVCDSKTMKHTAPPRLLDLSGGAARLAPRGIKTGTLQSLYQKMYEAGVLSYIRSEDHYITIEQFNELLPKVDEIARVVGVDSALLTHRAPRKTHIKAGMAHGANRPGPNVPKSLADLDARFGKGAGEIYELFARSFLTMFGEDYEYERQVGHVKDYPKFTGSVNVGKVAGWHAIDRGAVDTDDDDSTKGLGTKAEPIVADIVNPRPSLPTIRSLVNFLTKLDVGTGATRVSTLNEITKSSGKLPALMKESKGKLTLTSCGDFAYRLLPDTHIGDVMWTKHVQDQMAGIADGKVSADDGLADIARLVTEDIQVMQRNAQAAYAALGVSAPAAVERVSGIWSGREVSFKREFSGHRFTDEEVSRLLAGESIKLMDCVSAKTGRAFRCQGKLEEVTFNGKKFVGFKAETFLDENGEPIQPRDPKDYVTGTWKRKEVTFKRTWAGHTFTDEEAEKLLAGETIHITGCVSKSGKSFDCDGKLASKKWQGKTIIGFEPDFGGGGSGGGARPKGRGRRRS